MKVLQEFFHNRLWWMVTLAFVLLISAWTTFIMLSRHMPVQRLTTEEETRLLQTKHLQ